MILHFSSTSPDSLLNMSTSRLSSSNIKSKNEHWYKFTNLYQCSIFNFIDEVNICIVNVNFVYQPRYESEWYPSHEKIFSDSIQETHEDEKQQQRIALHEECEFLRFDFVGSWSRS
jgi:hypothetical protein